MKRLVFFAGLLLGIAFMSVMLLIRESVNERKQAEPPKADIPSPGLQESGVLGMGANGTWKADAKVEEVSRETEAIKLELTKESMKKALESDTVKWDAPEVEKKAVAAELVKELLSCNGFSDKEKLTDTLAMIGKPAIPPLVSALKSRKSATLAIPVLAKMGPRAREAVPDLLAMLNHNLVGSLGSAAIDALEKIGPEPKAFAAALLGFFKRNHIDTTRKCAIGALERIGPDAVAAVPMFKELLQNKDALSQPIIRTIGAIGPGAKEAVPVLAVYVLSNDDSLRRESIEALGRIGPGAEPAMDALRVASNDSNTGIKAWSHYAMARITGDYEANVRLLAKDLGDWNKRGYLISALVAMGEPALPALDMAYKAAVDEHHKRNTDRDSYIKDAIRKIKENAKKSG